MPRKPRTLSSTGIYHIILRSVNQHLIFEEESDYQKFLYILSDCKTKYDIDIYAYCIMDNHIHLLLNSLPESLSNFFQSIGSRFVRWYNTKYSRSGHLFQERFHSTVIKDDAQYLATLVYIHDNPVKANIVRYQSEYRWSSYNAFYGQKNTIVNTSFSFNIAGSPQLLFKYFSEYDDVKSEELFHNDHRETIHFLTDEQALHIFYKVTGLSTVSDVNALPKVQRNKYIQALRQNNLSQNQIARIMDVSVSTIKRVCRE